MKPASHHETGVRLAFETSSALGEVALGLGDKVREVRSLGGPRRHAVEFLPTIDALCRAHGVSPGDVSTVFVSSGPGSFTGLRIGVTAARILAFAHGGRLVAVPTLEVIAQNALRAAGRGSPPSRVAVVLDAKRRRVYAAAFVLRGDRYVAVSQPVEAEPARFLAQQGAIDPDCTVLGEGVPYHRDAVDASGLSVLPEDLYRPRAQTVFRLGVVCAAEGRFVDRRSLVPTYVRPPEAEEKWRERHRTDDRP
ncbi:MAG: tRNA (adenosine(37)-N6)-threonylcarbamoyltransferase complex dimerization subunit type 1 TsaB [Phycisphaerae bacterium]|jgi:tRNA threonylcarbamoyladenosine biosynthesis protein TsaB